MKPRIICNKIKTPDGTVLESLHVHDYKSYIDNFSKEEYIVDGGRSYLKRSINEVPYVELSVYSDEPFEKIRENFKWGTRGINGYEPLYWVRLCDMESDHIYKVLTYLSDGEGFNSSLMKEELKFRKVLVEENE